MAVPEQAESAESWGLERESLGNGQSHVKVGSLSAETRQVAVGPEVVQG